MIEITLRLKPACARRFADLLRTAAASETDRGQAKAYRGAARSIERAPGIRHATAGTYRYTPRVQRPQHKAIDEGALRRVIRGERPFPVLTRAEARKACWHLTQLDCPASEIAERVRIAQRTVHRWRAEDRQAVTR
ncbi:hypothetical protein [Streptomyces sp. NPDC001139]